jgi:hypothetical protein
LAESMAVEEAIAENAYVQGRKAVEEAAAVWANPPPCANPASVTPSAPPVVDFQIPGEKDVLVLDVPPPIPHFLAKGPIGRKARRNLWPPAGNWAGTLSQSQPRGAPTRRSERVGGMHDWCCGISR